MIETKKRQRFNKENESLKGKFWIKKTGLDYSKMPQNLKNKWSLAFSKNEMSNSLIKLLILEFKDSIPKGQSNALPISTRRIALTKNNVTNTIKLADLKITTLEPLTTQNKSTNLEFKISNKKISKLEVKKNLSSMLEKMGDLYSFGGWIDFYSDDQGFVCNEMMSDFSSGIVVQDKNGMVRFVIYSGYTFWSKDNIQVRTTIEKHNPPWIEAENFSWDFLKMGGYPYDVVEYCKDGLLSEKEWKGSGLNFYLIKAIGHLNKI